VQELPLLGEVKKHGSSIFNTLTLRFPLSSGVTSDAVSIFYLEEGDGGTYIIASRMEVYAHPSMLRSSVTKSSFCSFVTKESL
jgi:hypothetical protein